MQYFSYWNAVSYDLYHANLASFCVSTCKGSIILLNPSINFWKNCTKPRNNYTYYIVVGFGHSLRLSTFASLICRPSGVISNMRSRQNPRKVVILFMKLHFFSLQYNSCLYKYANIFTSSLKCSSSIVLYISMLSKKTKTPLSSMSTNRFFIICMNVSGAFVSPTGITIHSYSNTRLKMLSWCIFTSAIWHNQ